MATSVQTTQDFPPSFNSSVLKKMKKGGLSLLDMKIAGFHSFGLLFMDVLCVKMQKKQKKENQSGIMRLVLMGRWFRIILKEKNASFLIEKAILR
jgi:hypothetical protein